jgi:Flp pilus assembly protein TadD
MMKKLLLAGVLCLVWSGWAGAHVDIEGLPDSVAIMAFKQILYLTPDDHATRNKLAMALCRTDKFEEAQKELQIVLGKSPKDFDALDGMGVVLAKMGKYQEALKYFDQALQINKQDVMLHVHLSAAFHKIGMSDKARAAWKDAQSLATSREERKKMEQELKWVAGR